MLKPFCKIFSFFLLLGSCFTFAQTNLVPNPSFEAHAIVGCPSNPGVGQSPLIDNWNTLYNTPDYFNVCATSTNVSVPSNLLGYRTPASGNAYAGFWAYQSTTPSYHEIIGAQLISPLIKNQKYYVKFKLSFTLGYASNSAVDKVGLRFTNVQHSTSNPPLLNNIAHVYSSSIITDTTNWTSIFGSFIADSSYNFIEIGNLFDNAHTNIQILWPDGGSNESYYYIDDVCISTDSAYSANWTGIKENNLYDIVNVYPNPFTDYAIINVLDKEAFPIILTLYNVAGEIVWQEETANEKIILKRGRLQPGIYFLRGNNKEKNRYLNKIIIID